MDICGLCGNKFSVITNTHLKAKHSITIEEYKIKFPNSNVGFSLKPNLLPKNDTRYLAWKNGLKNRKFSNKGKTKFIDKRAQRISQTFLNKRIDNFKIWRESRKNIYEEIYKPFKKDCNLAFLYGMTLGDGNLHKFPRTECLRIALGTDKPLLIKYVAYIVQIVISKNPTIHTSSTAACSYVTIYQKHLSKRLGIPLGARGKISINFPYWIWKDLSLLQACLKGLFEAEGSLSVHIPTCTYNFAFSNTNVSLLDEVEKALRKFDMHPERRNNAVRLRKRKEVEKFREIISFRKYPLI